MSTLSFIAENILFAFFQVSTAHGGTDPGSIRHNAAASEKPKLQVHTVLLINFTLSTNPETMQVQ